MQQILNSQERNQAFLKFLLFFVITVSLVVAAIYFNFKVPVRENQWLQNQLDIQQIEQANQEIFVDKMQEAVGLLNSLDTLNSNSNLANSKLDAILGNMQEIEGNKNTLYGKMNMAIVAKFNDLKNAKKILSDSKGDAHNISILTGKVNDLQIKLEKANSDLDAYRNRASN